MQKRLQDVRDQIETVHKLLINAARAEYEGEFGRIAGPGVLLELLMTHPHFAWLRPMSGLMAEMDERLEEPEAIDVALLVAYRARLEALLLHERYVRYLQESADLVMEHAALRRAIASLAGG
jgi:hypothetical protein